MRAFAEAGSVGAIADWFAVTALFRHPLGLPIPHTAIIPRNKDEIGRALGAFVEQNFLTPENLARRFATVDAAGAAVRWLSSRRNSRRCARGICRLVPPMLDGLDDAAFRRLLDQAVLPQLERLEVAPLAGRLLEIMTLDGRHQALLDQGLRSLDGWLNENRTRIREKFSEASRYTSRIFDRYVVDRFVDDADRFPLDLILPQIVPAETDRRNLTAGLPENTTRYRGGYGLPRLSSLT